MLEKYVRKINVISKAAQKDTLENVPTKEILVDANLEPTVLLDIEIQKMRK